MSVRDAYRSFRDLSSREVEGYDFSRDMGLRASTTALVAIHGGGIEPGTGELARAIAGDDLSFYVFEGIKPRNNGILHIASTRFDDPLCLEVAAESDTVVAVHGCESDDTVVMVSGLAEEPVERLIKALNAAEFRAAHDYALHSGVHPRNICNRGRLGRGVQIEISRGLRLNLFAGLARRKRLVRRPEFYRFVATIRSVIVPGSIEPAIL
ncbi:poly-gamma-glutamate hydrolase family protein [Candidatus Fermentibacteria bacterium]|nr:poly-gamma-glutamate hydrolase family protein [Candidatus Fermentibacteria bacterium]